MTVATQLLEAPTESETPVDLSRTFNTFDYLKLPREPKVWLIKPVLPSAGSMLLYGDPKIGKSFAALQLAAALQNGGEWFGFPVTSPGQMLYVQLDTPRGLWAERLESVNINGCPLANVHTIDRGTMDTWPFDILKKDHFNILKEAVRRLGPAAVIIDTIRECHSGNENDSGDMRNVIAALTAATQPAALILIAHAKKPVADGSPDLMNDSRGSGYVVGKMDAIIRFTKKRIYYEGRAVEGGHKDLQRNEFGLWAEVGGEMSEIDKLGYQILADTTFDSLNDKAAVFAEHTAKSHSAARMYLTRLREAMNTEELLD